MISLLFQGGIQFMSVLTLILATNIGIFVFHLMKKTTDEHQTSLIKSVGLFALVFGLLGQFLGLYDALQYISEVETVSSAILAGGIKVSSITTIYGMIIFVISYLMWFGLKFIPKTS